MADNLSSRQQVQQKKYDVIKNRYSFKSHLRLETIKLALSTTKTWKQEKIYQENNYKKRKISDVATNLIIFQQRHVEPKKLIYKA